MKKAKCWKILQIAVETNTFTFNAFILSTNALDPWERFQPQQISFPELFFKNESTRYTSHRNWKIMVLISRWRNIKEFLCKNRDSNIQTLLCFYLRRKQSDRINFRNEKRKMLKVTNRCRSNTNTFDANAFDANVLNANALNPWERFQPQHISFRELFLRTKYTNHKHRKIIILISRWKEIKGFHARTHLIFLCFHSERKQIWLKSTILWSWFWLFWGS